MLVILDDPQLTFLALTFNKVGYVPLGQWLSNLSFTVTHNKKYILYSDLVHIHL